MSDAPQDPVRILASAEARSLLASRIAGALDSRPSVFVPPGEDADLAFVSRDITGLSTKHAVLPATQAFYDALLAAPSLRWVHAHSAGADRPIYATLRSRGVQVTTSSGANATIVVQTALAGILGMTRCFPQLMAAQRAHTWKPLVATGQPRDLAGQTAVIVGWGPIGRGLAGLLKTIGVHVIAVRSSNEAADGADATVAFENIADVLGRADWLVLVCPLTDRTRGLVDGPALRRLPTGARVVNVARGEVVDEAALIDALRSGALGGAYLDVFEHEPLPTDSPLWDLPNVMITPHTAGQSEGNERRVEQAFLDNLARWARGESLHNRSA